MIGAGRRAGTAELLFLLVLVVLALMVVSPVSTLAVAGAGVLLVVGIASVAAARSRRGLAPATAAEVAETDVRDESDRRLPSLWTAFLVTFAVFALDFGAVLSSLSSIRFAFLLVPLGVLVVSVRSAHGRPVLRAPDVVLGALVLWGITGAVYGQLVTHPVSSSLTMVLPMAAGLLHLWSSGRPTEEHSRRMLRYLTNLGLAYVLIYLAARLGVRPLSIVAYSKEKSFLLALAPMAAFVTRRWWFLAIEIVALALIYLQEPAATLVMVVAAVAVTNMLLSARSGAVKAAAVVVLAVSVFLGFSLVYRSGQQTTLITRYFETVGKGDNTPFRLVLLRKGTAEVKAHPILGNNFAGEIGIDTKFPGVARFAPAHNDYLQLAMAGGFVALSLFLYWSWATNAAVHSRYHRLVENGDIHSARLLRVLITSFNAFLFSALFNPLLAGVGIGVLFFLLYGSMSLLLHESVREPNPSPVAAAGGSS